MTLLAGFDTVTELSLMQTRVTHGFSFSRAVASPAPILEAASLLESAILSNEEIAASISARIQSLTERIPSGTLNNRFARSGLRPIMR
jgi:hypothetical protein